MHIEDIFEDLEAQFDSVSKKDPNQLFDLVARIVEIRTKTFRMELIAPIIGVDFIAGLDLEKPTWHIFSARSISEVRFIDAQDETLPLIRQLEQAMSDFLRHLPLPGLMRWRTFNDQDVEQIGAVRRSSGGFLVAHQGTATQPIFVPILALAQLSIDSIVDN